MKAFATRDDRSSTRFKEGKMDLTPLKRVRYSFGQVLGVDDFLGEQNYFRDKSRRHNRYLHGVGVVCGLEVEAGKDVLVIHPGLALNCEGEEVVVPQPVEMPLPGNRKSVYLTLHYAERETDPLPVAGTEEMVPNSRIEETYELTYQQENPCPGHRRLKSRCLPCGKSHGIPVAKMVYRAGRWRIDGRFRRPEAPAR